MSENEYLLKLIEDLKQALRPFATGAGRVFNDAKGNEVAYHVVFKSQELRYAKEMYDRE